MAAEIVTLAQVKTHLRLDAIVTDEDEYVKILMGAALRSIENATGRDISATVLERDQVVVRQAVLLLVSHWFINREAVGRDGSEMPMAVKWLIDPLRIWSL